MPLDPQTRDLLALVQAGTPMSEQTPEEARRAFQALTDLRDPKMTIPVASTEDRTVPGAAGDLRARVYRPEGEGPFPTVAFFHGGGFVIGDIDSHDNVARALCAHLPAVVVSVDYRLAPEDPFPAGVDDAVAVTRWLLDHLADFGGDDRLAVAGDSAGGNLSAVAAQCVPGLAGQFVIYPSVDKSGDYPSREENASGYMLDLPTMLWFVDHYVPEGVDPEDPRLSPIRGALTGLPPTVVVTAELDPLRDEGEAYAAALREAGVPVVVRRYDGLIHGFMHLETFSTASRAAMEDAIGLFAEVLQG